MYLISKLKSRSLSSDNVKYEMDMENVFSCEPQMLLLTLSMETMQWKSEVPNSGGYPKGELPTPKECSTRTRSTAGNPGILGVLLRPSYLLIP